MDGRWIGRPEKWVGDKKKSKKWKQIMRAYAGAFNHKVQAMMHVATTIQEKSDHEKHGFTDENQ